MSKIFRVITATPSGMVYAREMRSPAVVQKETSSWDDDEITLVRDSPAPPSGRKTGIPV